MLVGTWGHQDAESIHYMTLANDGTVNATMTWKDQFKQLFHQDVRSSGTWQVQDGVVTITIDILDRQRTPRPNGLVPRADHHRQRDWRPSITTATCGRSGRRRSRKALSAMKSRKLRIAWSVAWGRRDGAHVGVVDS